MATQDFETLRARVQALGHQLLTDDSTRTTAEPRFYVLDASVSKLTGVMGGSAADVEAWCESREGDDDDSAPADSRAEGIRLQAERVVRAYKELRDDAHSADFNSGQFPVGLYAELAKQIAALDGLLESTAWTTGSALALALIEDAHDVGQAALLEAQYRETGKPQNNIVLGYLRQAESLGDPHVTEAFAAVLSEYISSCENGGVPDVSYLRKIAASPPGLGTGETAETEGGVS